MEMKAQCFQLQKCSTMRRRTGQGKAGRVKTRVKKEGRVKDNVIPECKIRTIYQSLCVLMSLRRDREDWPRFEECKVRFGTKSEY